ncbi:hypothetical protein HYDPIDRAFT_128779 [Hydnomerulius pinastri MD-312]|nr:hypothetical protein HYDPIDRAFT_128779 [Hydnomerulius pinastri MD-312]
MSSDEFDEYNFSEFTEEDLACIDADVSRKTRGKSSEALSESSLDNTGVGASPTGGPAIQIAMELETDTCPENVKALPPLDERVPGNRYHGGRARSTLQPAATVRYQSPFERFCSWKKSFSVTELVGPTWCEVQFEYGLYGQRNRPLEQRPSSFKSKSGKEIRVRQDVAQTNDRRLKRGKVVHKALEEELRPEKVIVQVFSDEERFGLRLVQLIEGFNELRINGLTRELPVFTITHGQVVLGVIDEVTRSPLSPENQGQYSAAKRSPTPPPGSPAKKKQRRFASPSQQQITTFFPGSPGKAESSSSDANEVSEDSAMVIQSDAVDRPQPGSSSSRDAYELRIIDYKTRKAHYIPPDEETLSSRLQLMLYHRMLSSVLAPEAFDFDHFWRRMNLKPTKPFSDQFLKDIKWSSLADTTFDEDLRVDLERLVAVWISTVHSERTERAHLKGINPELQIVYRKSLGATKGKGKGKDKGKGKETAETEDPLEALALQEELDLARAIEQSLRHIGHEEGEAINLSQLVAQNVKQAGSSNSGGASAAWKQLVNPSGAEQEDSELAWAIQQSLLSCAQNARDQAAGTSSVPHGDAANSGPSSSRSRSPTLEPESEGEEHTTSDIIGTKEFLMNDGQLDTHLANVLEWWLGTRPARGVEVAQSNRCFTCEYRESCEWREQKAAEAALALMERRRCRNGAKNS